MSTFNDFINHLMANKGGCCHAPSGRYCEQGKRLKAAYSKECKGAYYEFKQLRNTGFKSF